MIYTSPIDSLTWKDIEEFCDQGIAEGAFLDYKSTFPADLARTIAAMGNTLGGVILIGVDEADGKPKMPLAGIPVERGLSERVTNIVLSNIAPPLFPEVAVCPNEDGSRVLLAIRIAQSPDAPHAIQANTRVYLRTGNRNSPEQLATLDEVGWLQDKRQRSVSLREQLHGGAYARSKSSFSNAAKKFRGGTADTTSATLILSLVPMFPGSAFATPPQLRLMFRDIQVRDYYGTDAMFPIGGSNPTLLQSGVCVDGAMDGDSGGRAYYTELNTFGQFFYSQTLASNVQGKRVIRASELFCRMDEFVSAAKKFLDKIGYQGYVLLTAILEGANVALLGHWQPSETGMELTSCPDETVVFERPFLVAGWEVESIEAIVAALTKIGWAYDWDIPRSLVERYYATKRRS